MIHELLRAEDLLLDCGGSSRIHHMDFAVTAGESVGVFGLSGGGKTTLAKILCGELVPDHGRILQNGAPLPREQLKEMGIRISGEDRLLGNLSVQEHLMVLRRPSGMGQILIPWRKIQKSCRELLREFQLEAYRSTPVSEIPVPVQHRLMMVRAAAQGKRLIVLDHISDTYSASDEEQLSACIGRLCGQGASVLYLASYIDSVLRELDRVTVMRDGRRIKELARGTFTEPSLRAYMYGYRTVAEESVEIRGPSETIFSMDGIPMPREGLIPVHDTDGSVNRFVSRLQDLSGRSLTLCTAESLFDSWVEELSVLDNLLLAVSRRLSGPGFHVRRSAQRMLCRECMGYTGLSLEQMDQPFGQLNRMDRFKLLQYRCIVNRTDLYVLDRITSGADLRDRENMRRTAGNLPGLIFYISGDYGSLLAFRQPVYLLQNGFLRKKELL